MPLTRNLKEDLSEVSVDVFVISGNLFPDQPHYLVLSDNTNYRQEIVRVRYKEFSANLSSDEQTVYSFRIDRAQLGTLAASFTVAAGSKVTLFNLPFDNVTVQGLDALFNAKALLLQSKEDLANLQNTNATLQAALNTEKQNNKTLEEAYNKAVADVQSFAVNVPNYQNQPAFQALVAIAQTRRIAWEDHTEGLLATADLAVAANETDIADKKTEIFNRRSDLLILTDSTINTFIRDIFITSVVENVKAEVVTFYQFIIEIAQVFQSLLPPLAFGFFNPEMVQGLNLNLSLGVSNTGKAIGDFKPDTDKQYDKPVMIHIAPQASTAPSESGGARLGERVPLAPPP